ncbi:MAG: DUF99 family protein [Candidatus Micrarchaeaceae archaeon]
MKAGSRIIAFDDAPFRKADKKCLVVGVVKRQSEVEGVLSFNVDVDGIDATKMMIEHILKSRFKNQIRLIAINGIVVAGLNVVDMVALYKKMGFPVIAVTRRKPHAALLENAVRKSGRNVEMKLKILRRISKIKIERIGGFYVQPYGIAAKDAENLVGIAAGALRLAHMIASGVTSGESKGRL